MEHEVMVCTQMKIKIVEFGFIATSLDTWTIGNNLKTIKNERLKDHEMEQLYYLIKRLQRLYASNVIITKLWLATTNKA